MNERLNAQLRFFNGENHLGRFKVLFLLFTGESLDITDHS
jgi:hypothetical protein